MLWMSDRCLYKTIKILFLGAVNVLYVSLYKDY